MVEEALRHYGYAAIGVTLMLESMGAPLPGESMLIAAAIYAATTHRMAIEWIIPVAAGGAILGDQLGYALGWWAGFPLLRRWGARIGLTEARLELGRYLFRRHGPKVVFFGRFVVVLRTLAALLAGASHMEWRRFLLWNALGGLAWTILYGLGAYLFGNVVARLSGPVGIACGVVGAALVLGAFLLLKRREREVTARVEAQMREERGEGDARPGGAGAEARLAGTGADARPGGTQGDTAPH